MYPIDQLLQYLAALNYIVYTQPWQLNIIGVRASIQPNNQFNDVLVVAYKNQVQQWVVHYCKGTTLPGRHWLTQPINPAGTAILQPNQYVDAYQIGWHRGAYKALVQVKPVTVYRDTNRNEVPDTVHMRTQTGLFGINIHRTHEKQPPQWVNKNTAGCQVMQSRTDFDTLMQLAIQHQSLYGNRFTYTLIEERAYKQYFQLL
ncbi:hypothetical protein ACFOWM_05585 [Ferruginibacter yonginensis]|uniref:Uncharacterized protein n=1 Tax=Ferruginibacter yonginensis TaxID=1310416 RepID=A0ABV8QRU9_9BACT